MRVLVDTNLCTGHGRCASVAPTVFALDDTGYNVQPEVEVAAGDEAAARLAVASCPEGCLRLAE